MKVDISFKINIIYEHEDYIIIEKPSGLLVHSIKNQEHKTLVDWFLKHYPNVKNISGDRPGIVHRLDKDVSGLMILAKNKQSQDYFINQFKNNKVKKEYIALVCNNVDKKGEIDYPIARTKTGKIIAVKYRKKIKLEKPALTKYKLVKKFKDSNNNTYSLLKVYPITGRTNQIRVHFKSIGCPIVNDKKYGFQNSELSRIFLHAHYLGFYDVNNKYQEFYSDLPKDLKDFLNKIEN